MSATLSVYTRQKLALNEALSAFAALIDANRATAILYSPRRCQLANFANGALQGSEGQPVDMGSVFEARVFNEMAELRWLNDPGPDLDYTDGQKFNRGLRQLARVLGEEIRRGRAAGSVELAATGGFKAEIAVANLVGAIFEAPVHYLYQEFSSIVTIDPIPVTLRADWLHEGVGRKLLEQFETAANIIPVSRIEHLLKQDERLITLVELDGDEAALNLLGELALRLLESPAIDWFPPTDKPPSEKIHLASAGHHRPPGWQQIVDKIAASRYVTAIRYESSVAGGCLKEAPDNDSDLIHRIDGSPSLTLRISTTAKTAAQRRLVQQVLRKELKA